MMADAEHEISISRAEDAQFEDVGRRAQLIYRDLGVREATGGRYDARVLRTGTGERKVPRHVHKLDFQMVYVLKGWKKDPPRAFQTGQAIFEFATHHQSF